MGILSGLWTGAKMVLGLGSGSGKGSDNVMSVAKGIGGYIDEQKFTAEEQAVHNAAMIGKFGSFMDTTMSENTERSKSRREIALLIMRWELAMLTFSALLYKIDKELAIFIKNLATDDPVGYLVLGVGAFFFGAHIVRAMKK